MYYNSQKSTNSALFIYLLILHLVQVNYYLYISKFRQIYQVCNKLHTK